jgi:uncharacterized protein YPO0396
MSINKIIEILEKLVINAKANCDDIDAEKELVKEAANKIVELNYIELPFDEGREKCYNLFLKED